MPSNFKITHHKALSDSIDVNFILDQTGPFFKPRPTFSSAVTINSES